MGLDTLSVERIDFFFPPLFDEAAVDLQQARPGWRLLPFFRSSPARRGHRSLLNGRGLGRADGLKGGVPFCLAPPPAPSITEDLSSDRVSSCEGQHPLGRRQ